MKKQATEETLSKAFEGILGNGIWEARHARLTGLLREMRCHQGQPDFVASVAASKRPSEKVRNRLRKALSRPATVRVMSLLKRGVARRAEYLVRSSGLSRKVVWQVLRELGSTRLVREVRKGSYILTTSLEQPVGELWAFEVKVKDWQRAMYQALQYRAFAHRVAIVLESAWADRVERHKERFRRLGVGIIGIDSDSGAMKVLLSPRKREPASRFHHLFAVGQFMNRRSGRVPQNPRKVRKDQT